MIIFFKKHSGLIVGSIAGRINSKEELTMWIGEPFSIDRLVIQWKQDALGNWIPDHEQPEVLVEVEKYPMKLYDYKIDPVTKRFSKIS
jgi:hypothetical protein